MSKLGGYSTVTHFSVMLIKMDIIYNIFLFKLLTLAVCTKPYKDKFNNSARHKNSKKQTQFCPLFLSIIFLTIYINLLSFFVGKDFVLFSFLHTCSYVSISLFLCSWKSILHFNISVDRYFVFKSTKRFLWYTDLMYDEANKEPSQDVQYINSLMTVR